MGVFVVKNPLNDSVVFGIVRIVLYVPGSFVSWTRPTAACTSDMRTLLDNDVRFLAQF